MPLSLSNHSILDIDSIEIGRSKVKAPDANSAGCNQRM